MQKRLKRWERTAARRPWLASMPIWGIRRRLPSWWWKTEIEKLATYAADRKMIRREDVSALVVSEKTTTVWELADMLASRQQRKALQFLDRLLRDGEEPLPMLGAITWM